MQGHGIGHVFALAVMAAVLASTPATAQGQAHITAGGEAGPRFRPDGPWADVYGQQEGYPSCPGLTYIREPRCRVGTFSHFDNLFPSRTIAAAKTPAPLDRPLREREIRYSYFSQSRTIDQYLDANHVTGLLIAQGSTILVERYQYGRTDKQRMTSFSMAKTIIGLLIGIAVNEGAIRSVDDLAEVYVPGLKDTEYGRTPIKALLQMSSGVTFHSSDIYILARLANEQAPGGSLAAVKRFNARHAQPGQRFSYSSAESLVLGLVLAGATRRTVADYASEKLWVPLGAEADATWITDATGQEVTYAYFNAILRDWARLGLMLAHDGMWQGRSIVSRDWLLAATSVGPDSPFWSPSLKPGLYPPAYGYQVRLLLADRRTFALRGLHGQFVMVDPEKKLVLVQTSLRDGSEQELDALWSALAAQLP